MFLSKKNAIYFNKPKNLGPNKPQRILAGWDNEDDDKKVQYDFAPTKYESKTPMSNLIFDDGLTDLTTDVPIKKENAQKFYLNWDELNEKDDIQCEKRVVQDIVQPGGIRIKPNQTMLNEFLKEVKGMEVHMVGSLLLSKIEVNYPFQTKAKALYTIDFLAKKNDVYQSYFKANADKIKQFPEPEDNVQNYKKILKSVLNGLGLSTITQAANNGQQSKPQFVDPGYNDDPKSMMSNFIQENSNKTKKTENKKVIIGPGQKSKANIGPTVHQPKTEDPNNDFLSLDLLGGTSQNTYEQTNVNQQGQGGSFSFDDMLGGFGGNTSEKKERTNSNNNFLI